MRTSRVVLVGVAAVLAVVAAGPAAADPIGTPPADAYVVVGSKTLAPLYDQFAADYPGNPPIDNIDSDGGTVVTPKAGCSPITRPYYSTSGLLALGANATTADGARYCVDIVRSSRAPKPGDPAGLSWLALAGDDVSWAAVDGGNAPDTLSALDLYDIYTCTVRTWAALPDAPAGASTATIDPVLPDPNSDTRNFFLQALNASQGLAGQLAPGSCVDTTSQPDADQATDPFFDPAGNPDAVNIVYPYSAAVYAAQVYDGHATATSNPGALTLRQIEGTDPVTVSGPYHVIDPDFDPDFQRLMFNVVRTASLNTTAGRDGDVGSIVGPSGWECADAVAQNDVESYGFLGLGPNCGATLYTT